MKPTRFASWVAERFPRPEDALAAYFNDAVAAAASLGCTLDETPLLDEAAHYLPNQEGKHDKRQYYRASIEQDADGTVWPCVTFKTFRHGGDAMLWKPRELAYQDFMRNKGEPVNDNAERLEAYSAEAARRMAETAARKAEREVDEQKGREAAAAAAANAWDIASDDTSAHPYLIRKGVAAHGLRVATKETRAELRDRDGNWQVRTVAKKGDLLIPLISEDGEIRNVQRITADDKPDNKRFVAGGQVSGLHHYIPGTGPAWLAEGYATAASVHEATGAPVVIGFAAGNLPNLKHLAERVAADNDESNAGKNAAEATGLPWIMPKGVKDWNDYHAAQGLEKTAHALAGALTQPANENQLTPSQGFGFTRVADMLHHLKPIDWLVRGYLEADSLALLFGDPGCGKSFIAIDLACAIATGTEWHGKETTRGAVFYIAGEGHNGLARRFKAWELLNEQPLKTAPLFVSHRSASLYDAASAAMVSEAVQSLADESGQLPRLIVIDTLARNFGGADENSTSDMNAFVTNLDIHLKDRFGACVLIVHHTGHADKSRARGAMALKGALDAEYQLQRDDDGGLIRLNTTKMKDAEHPEPLSFSLERVALPFLDEDGQPVFGAAPKSTAYVPPAKPGKMGRGKNQTTALQVLSDLESEHRERLEDKGYNPEQALVKESTWREALEERYSFNRFQFRDAREGLIKAGLVVSVLGGYVRIA